MTIQDFYKYLNHPELLGESQIRDLVMLCEQYPAFVSAKMLYIKALQNSGNVLFQSEMKKNTLFVSDVRKFFFYLYPDEKLNEVHFKRDEKYSGNYFDMLQVAGVSNDVQDNSLKKLAEKLKQARNMITHQTSSTDQKTHLPLVSPVEKKEIVIPVIDYFKLDNADSERNEARLEQQYKNLIQQKKYAEALQTLKELNLINPKKSIYFADQIRFLEKVLNIQYN